jgi:hypothetical protein
MLFIFMFDNYDLFSQSSNVYFRRFKRAVNLKRMKNKKKSKSSLFHLDILLFLLIKMFQLISKFNKKEFVIFLLKYLNNIITKAAQNIQKISEKQSSSV